MHLQRNATQRNATQRNAYHNYILNNNFKFYILQFFRAFNFLSAIFGFAKIFSFIKESKSSYFFEWQKSKHANPKGTQSEGGQSSKTISFCQKEDKARLKAHRVKPAEAKTTPFRIRNSLVKIFSQYSESPSFAEGVLWERGDSRSNPICLDCHDFLRSLAMTMKNQFEIISQLNYGFCYKNYFFNLNQVFRNSYDFGENYDFGRNLNYGFGKDYNRNFKKNCDYDFEKNCNGSFGKNNFGNCNFGFDFGNEICGIGNNLAGFLFNRKTKKNKFMSAHSVGEGEQK